MDVWGEQNIEYSYIYDMALVLVTQGEGRGDDGSYDMYAGKAPQKMWPSLPKKQFSDHVPFYVE